MMSDRIRRNRKPRLQHSMRRRAIRLENLEDRRMLAGESLIISEFMASNNSTLRDDFRSYSDWIEIHNPTEETVSVDGWYLTDDVDNLSKWRLPAVSIDRNGFLIVFASGQDQANPEDELHANFRLSSGGEYIALVRPDSTIAHAYEPRYPEQASDISYGIAFDSNGGNLEQLGYFANPTPGEPNLGEVTNGISTDVTFSVRRGFFDEPFDVTLTNETPGSVIRYTTDGTMPREDHGEIYTAPITITTTTPLRAAAFGEGLLASEVGTQTYIFLNDVLTQDGEGLPEEWGHFDDLGPRPPARVKANYEVDSRIVEDEDYKDTIKDDLRSIPTISLVLDPEDLWGFEQGLYSNPQRTGPAWERATSIEMFDGNGETKFQADAGLRIHGGWARRFSQTKKLSFRVHFRGEYGEPTLDYPLFGDDGQQNFQAIVLRGGFNDSWRSSGSQDTYLQDQWARQAQIDVGGFTSRDSYAHLYLNGMYWGLYSPTERMNAEWAASYMGGEPEEWDVINTGGNVIDGNTREWSRLMRAAGGSNVDYDELASMVDMEDFVDYLIVNQYVGNWDWPHNNWYASKRRVDGAKWRFHTWDAEAAFQRGIGENRVRPSNIENQVGPSRLYLALQPLPQFQDLFADRIAKHLLNDGELTSEAGIERLNALASEIDRAIVGESARWGDGKDDNGRPNTRESWERRVSSINRGYFPRRGDRMLAIYRDADLYPSVDPPQFNQFGGHVSSDFDITLTSEVPGVEIYFTDDGSDPRGPDGQPNDNAIRLNSTDFVAPDSNAKIIVPTGAPAEADWQSLDYDDSAWTDGLASIGYDTGESEDPLSVVGGFTITEYISTERINSPAEADLVLAGENLRRTHTTEGVPVLNFLGGVRGGNFDGDSDFPNGVDNFVVDATATIRIRESGTYTFGVTSNDAARLEMDGQVLFADEDRHSTRDQFVTVDLAAGDHDVRVVMFDRTSTGVLEFYYTQGEKTEFDESFLLVGDAKHRPFDNEIMTDLQDQLAGVNASAYMRIRFEATGLDNFDGLFLKTRHDDGFVAYLNGVQVASRFAPDMPSFDSSATDSRFDTDTLFPELIDLTESKDLLRDGQNVLAIHALNSDKSDVDMFYSTQLFASLGHAPINLDESTTIRTRVLENGTWSALVETRFLNSVPASAENLRISEIHYHPRRPTDAEIEAGFDNADDFEFIELVNTGTEAIDLSAVRFEVATIEGAEQGVSFNFAQSDLQELRPGEYALIVEDAEAFRFRYGDTLPVAGQWSGRLSNASETLTLVAGTETIHQFAYTDDWYAATDGQGFSLEVADPAGHASDAWGTATIWKPSQIDGTPGAGPADIVGDANRDGVFDSADLTLIFQAGEFEDDVADNSTWEDGDWNGDGDFTSRDIVLAFQIGKFTANNPPAAVTAALDAALNSALQEHSALQEPGTLNSAKLEDDLVPALGPSLNDHDKIFQRGWI